jgi:hypothetical protein
MENEKGLRPLYLRVDDSDMKKEKLIVEDSVKCCSRSANGQ